MSENGVIRAEFDMLVQPEQYTNKRGQPATAHNLSVRIDGVGTGQLYVTQEIYQSVQRAGAKRGDALEIEYRLALWNGKLEPRIHAVHVRVAQAQKSA